jgi:XRE family aerobic/anaerobic benzoate catabolism transcriptional regulator
MLMPSAPSDPAFPARVGVPRLLAALATRVRRLRGGFGWNRAELAARSGLSVRFLARVESGEGNISILRLEALAQALDTSAHDLLRPDADAPVIVALVGLRGAGKSTVGPLLARRLGRPFVEMDRLITESSGLQLDQLFELHGEPYYRRLERETVQRVLDSGEPIVLAAAGGVVNDPVTWNLLCSKTFVVWLEATPEEHWNRVVAQGDRRPMADNPAAREELRALLEAREPAYSAARITARTTGRQAEAIADEIAARLAEPI